MPQTKFGDHPLISSLEENVKRFFLAIVALKRANQIKSNLIKDYLRMLRTKVW
jgi:hypothetical protein